MWIIVKIAPVVMHGSVGTSSSEEVRIFEGSVVVRNRGSGQNYILCIPIKRINVAKFQHSILPTFNN